MSSELITMQMIQGQSNASKAVRIYLGGAFSVLQLESGTRTATTTFLEKVCLLHSSVATAHTRRCYTSWMF